MEPICSKLIFPDCCFENPDTALPKQRKCKLVHTSCTSLYKKTNPVNAESKQDFYETSFGDGGGGVGDGKAEETETEESAILW